MSDLNHQSGKEYKNLFENAIEGIFQSSMDGRLLKVNPAMAHIYGYDSPEDMLTSVKNVGKQLYVNTQDRKKYIEELKMNGRCEGFETQNYRKDKSIIWVQTSSRIIYDEKGKALFLEGFLTEITKRKETEEALRESEEQFKKIFQANPIASCIATLKEGRFLTANDSYWKLAGFKPNEFIGHTSIELGFVDKNGRKALIQRLQRERSIHNENGRLITKSGKIRNTLEFFDIITFNGQECILSMFYDVTEKSNTQKAIQESEERFRLSFQTSPDAININRLEDGLYVDINDGFTSITGYTREDVIGKTSFEIDIWDDKRDRAKLVEGLKKDGFVNNLEAKFHLKNGWTVTGLISARVITLDDAPHIISITREIETLKQTEKTLQRQLKELTILHNVAVATSSSNSLDELIERVTDTIGDTFHPENCGVELVEDNGSTYAPHPSYRGVSVKENRKPLSVSKGIAGKVITTGKLVRVGDVTHEPAYVEATKGMRSELCVPITIHERVIGVLNIESKLMDAFDEADERLFNTIAGTLATAIEQLRLFEMSQRQLIELETLNTVANAGARATNIDDLIEEVTQIIGETLYLDNFGLLLLNETGDILIPHPSYRGITNKDFPKSIKLGQGVSGQVALTRKSLRLKNVQNHKIYIGVTSKIHSELCVPITHGEHIFGVINAESIKVDAFTENDEQLLTTIANTIATTIEKLRLFEKEKKRHREVEILFAATSALTTSLDLDTLLDSILEMLSRIVPYDTASIAIEQNDKLIIIAGKGFHPEYEVIGKQLGYSEKWLLLNAKRQAHIVADAQLEPSFEQWEGSEYIRGWMGVPMVVHDKLIGFINLDSCEPNSFKSEDALLAQTFANSAAVAIENVRLFEAEQRRHRESETLRQAALAITTSLDLENVLETILIVMKQVIPYDNASVLLLEGDELRITAVQGFQNLDEVLNLHFSASDELFNVVRNSDEPIIIKDAQQDPRFKNWANTNQIHGWMGVSLILRNKVIGCITFDSQQKDIYNEKLSTLAQAFANQAASAIQNARQFEAEQRHSYEAEMLRQAAEAITSTLDIQQVLKSVLDNLNHVIPFDSASVFLIENESVRLTAASGTALQDDSINRTFPAKNALFREIWKTRLPLILKDVRGDSRFEKWVVENVCGWMGVPLITRGAIIGYITIDSHKPDAYNTHDANLAMTFAHQAATALENARLYERGEQQIRQLTVLRDIDSAISSSFDLRVTLNLLIGHASKELDVDAAAILLYNTDIHSLSVYASTGFTEQTTLFSSPLRIGEGFAGHVALQRKLVQVSDISKDATHHRDTAYSQQGFKSYFGVPLIGKGQIKGVLEVYTRDEFHPNTDWLNFLHTLAGQAAIAIDNGQLFTNLQRSNQELTLAYDTTLEGWGRALELRDKETQGHTNRVVELTIELALRMGIDGEELTHIMRGVLLHDIGKMGVPDNILNKPESLTKEEWEIMQQHPKHAYDLMYPITYLRPALDIPYSHHERWNGKGYPQGLKGEEIPIAARIFAVIDIWDALLYERPYREAWSENKVLEYIKNAAGVELDPNIVEKFLELLKEEKHFRKRAE